MDQISNKICIKLFVKTLKLEIPIIIILNFHHLKSKVHWCIFETLVSLFCLFKTPSRLFRYGQMPALTHSRLFRYGQMPLSRRTQRGNFSLMKTNRQKCNCCKLICFFLVFLSVVCVLGEDYCLFLEPDVALESRIECYQF